MAKIEPHRVAICGNHTFPLTPQIGKQIVDLMVEAGKRAVFLTRGTPGVDQFVMRAAPILGRPCFQYRSAGGNDNWIRDNELARDADEVIAFLDPDTLHREDTGTAHVIEAALDKKKRVRAFTVADEKLIYVGEHP